ncbi:hypothetical protein SELR_pSRC102000 (plasmid) [Selenomonas ruminantium subsp. lactilytica TAM6421]|uniref:Inner membrane protein yeeR n=1 Tax=Selenomonas ruminantium subsp. lactilytica (strain NBRC 103574 / TAM6421) TaxID=927704 RepID=I0GW70_SELRL|nr:hypothetical protein [Selenomonas ruminantium]BAL85007.1 hypothetical protein SELR_pSRC102000 [Selenomonas ruminantium subsp. lactilytica TAM6421]
MNKRVHFNSQKDKYINNTKEFSGTYHGAIESGSHADRLTRFNSRQGQGYAAEQANHIKDIISGHDAEILGDNNKKNGPDRKVDGELIQTKYCKTAVNTVNAAFKNGQYRYIDTNGQAMQLEVPKDQYQDAIKYMKKRIQRGQIPGVTDPGDAVRLIRKGNVDYKTACRIAKAGNIDSLIFDAAHGIVIATSAMGISAIVTYARAIWQGKTQERAIDEAMLFGLQSGGIAFVGSVLTSQIARTEMNRCLLTPSIKLVKMLPSNIRRLLVSSLKQGAPIFGQSATKDLAKLVRSNAIAAGVMVICLSAVDITNFFRGRISATELFKKVSIITAGIGGGYIGSTVGTAVAGPFGTVAGGITGSIVGGSSAEKLLSHFVEDDAKKMLTIINDELIPLVEEYFLSQIELEIVLEDLKIKLENDKLLDMFASQDRHSFARNILIEVIENTVKWRTSSNRIILPSNELFIFRLGHILDMGQRDGELEEYFSDSTVDTQTFGRQIMQREVSRDVSNKAWYVTSQFNKISMQASNELIKMSNNEEMFKKIISNQELEIDEYIKEMNLLMRE